MNSWDDRRAPLVDLAPALRRAVGLDPRCVVRLRFAAGRATALIRLPFGILVSRAVSTDAVATDGASGTGRTDAGGRHRARRGRARVAGGRRAGPARP